jgi:hypothetical protein
MLTTGVSFGVALANVFTSLLFALAIILLLQFFITGKTFICSRKIGTNGRVYNFHIRNSTIVIWYLVCCIASIVYLP